MKNKAQTEAIGLAVIVILISLAIIFALAFSLREKPTIKETYLKAQLASNTLNALLKTKTSCCVEGTCYTVSQLLQNCIENYRANQINCSGKLSCDFTKTQIERLLSETLAQWKKHYALTIGIGNEIYFNFTNPPLKGSRELETFPLSTREGIVLITLELYD
ncbi:hypothetical protein DRJ16_01460 [Candidatus Woesearchaeota archaeon]|nr:MAG: hypothetical protein DRJ16_01460 [Candidatus Woesearchaeota archaeon]